jgi:predicted NAD-dependent protein-ADP-ribosyltransferase YbiA (DUF1768 family)
MNKIDFIKQQFSNPKSLRDLATVVEYPQDLIPQREEDFSQLCKFGLYPADECQPFVTKQGTPFYHLDNMSVLPLGQEDCWMHYGDFKFRQIEVLYNMVRMDSVEAHNWLKDNLFQQRVDARKKQEYKAKFRDSHRQDWKRIQIEWMKYCLNLKYRDNVLFRKDLLSTDKLPVEDATATNYASNLFWGAKLIELGGKKYYFGCNVLGKLLAQLRETKGNLLYTLPDDLHLFGKPILSIR